MGKRQHQKDKMYLTYTEWTTLYGGKKVGTQSSEEIAFKRLPFDHCCVSLQPFENAYCDRQGNLFDLQPLILYLKKYKTNPVTGESLDVKALIKVNFHKNAEGEYHCPVLFKTFTKNSYFAIIGTTGNVFSMEAIAQLNIKNKNWKDLITDQAFERKDIIVLQDPNNLNKFNISLFHHVKNNLRVETEEEIADRSDPNARLRSVNVETKYILEELNREYKAPEKPETKALVKADKFNAAHYSTGKVAAGFTSTTMTPELTHEPAIIHEDLVRYERIKKKAYVRLVTNLGPLNLELHSDIVAKTAENFLKHCLNGYYNGTKFHRSIRNFMIQGGDPTGKGTGGNSIWEEKFEDEFKPNLTHTGRGVLSMANSGTNTNGSQFFITYRSCKQLDNKHTVFGRVVGGMETLSEMEKIEVDNKDRPIEDIFIMRAQIFVDPFQEADEQLDKERLEELNKASVEEAIRRRKINAQKKLTVFRDGIGKYISPNSGLEVEKTDSTLAETPTTSSSGVPIAKKKKRDRKSVV